VKIVWLRLRRTGTAHAFPGSRFALRRRRRALCGVLLISGVTVDKDLRPMCRSCARAEAVREFTVFAKSGGFK
jgi:hypothetical protein